MNEEYIIKLDFDGTVVEHDYPAIGLQVPYALVTILQLQNAGHQIELNTYRANINSKMLDLAIEYLENHSININKVLPRKEQPLPWNWDSHNTNKMIYIDDICQGIPLINGQDIPSRRMVDWGRVHAQLIGHGVIS